MTNIRDYIVKNIKIVIPVIVVAVVAILVTVVLSATNSRAEGNEGDGEKLYSLALRLSLWRRRTKRFR